MSGVEVMDNPNRGAVPNAAPAAHGAVDENDDDDDDPRFFVLPEAYRDFHPRGMRSSVYQNGEAQGNGIVPISDSLASAAACSRTDSETTLGTSSCDEGHTDTFVMSASGASNYFAQGLSMASSGGGGFAAGSVASSPASASAAGIGVGVGTVRGGGGLGGTARPRGLAGNRPSPLQTVSPSPPPLPPQAGGAGAGGLPSSYGTMGAVSGSSPANSTQSASGAESLDFALSPSSTVASIRSASGVRRSNSGLLGENLVGTDTEADSELSALESGAETAGGTTTSSGSGSGGGGATSSSAGGGRSRHSLGSRKSIASRASRASQNPPRRERYRRRGRRPPPPRSGSGGGVGVGIGIGGGGYQSAGSRGSASTDRGPGLGPGSAANGGSLGVSSASDSRATHGGSSDGLNGTALLNDGGNWTTDEEDALLLQHSRSGNSHHSGAKGGNGGYGSGGASSYGSRSTTYRRNMAQGLASNGSADSGDRSGTNGKMACSLASWVRVGVVAVALMLAGGAAAVLSGLSSDGSDVAGMGNGGASVGASGGTAPVPVMPQVPPPDSGGASSFGAGSKAAGGAATVGSGAAGAPASGTTPSFPFPVIDRADYGDSAAEVVDAALFDPSLIANMPLSTSSPAAAAPQPSEANEKERETAEAKSATQTNGDGGGGGKARPFLKVPFPTGAFWTNLVLKHSSTSTHNKVNKSAYSFPAMAYPYAYRWNPSKLQVSYPPLRRTADDTSIRDIFAPDLTFSSREAVASRGVMGFDPLSVTVRFRTAATATTAEASTKTTAPMAAPAASPAGSGEAVDTSQAATPGDSTGAAPGDDDDGGKRAMRRRLGVSTTAFATSAANKGAEFNSSPTSSTAAFNSMTASSTLSSNDGRRGRGRAGHWESYLVQGSPYITLAYSSSTPVIEPLTTFAEVACPRDAAGRLTDGGSAGTAAAMANESGEKSEGEDVHSTAGDGASAGGDGGQGSGEDIDGDRGSTGDGDGGRRLGWGVCGVVGGASESGKASTVALHGVQFLLRTRENLSWLVFASEPITLRFDSTGKRTVSADKKFTGVLRLALIPPPNVIDDGGSTSEHDSVQLSSSSGVRRLIYHAGVYPVGAKVAWEFRRSGSDGGGTQNGRGAGGGGGAFSFSSGGAGLQLNKHAVTGMGNKPLGVGVTSIVEKAVTGMVSGGGSSSTSSISGGAPTSTGRIGTVKFAFETRSMADSPAGMAGATGGGSTGGVGRSSLLMLALPHHVDVLESGTLKPYQFDLSYSCVKGRLTPVVGDNWSYDESLPSLGFDDLDAVKNVAAMDQSVKDVVLRHVKKDVKGILPALNENVYGFGKQVARLAQLVHISNTLSPTHHTKIAQKVESPASAIYGRGPVAASAVVQGHNKAGTGGPSPTSFIMDAERSLHTYLTALLKDDASDKLLYDSNFGGIITRDGLEDTGADFGNGRYNDHHFHYGYVLYACAVLGRVNSTFVSEYGQYVDALLYDVAHSSFGDSADSTDGSFFFPLARHKSWYDGHSFASGLFPFADGKSQESSSEAVNCYYGAYLWSMVRWGDGADGDTGSSHLTDFARLLLATEIRGAKTYWHMTPPSDSGSTSSAPKVYNPTFRKNYMVGNVGMMDAVCSTWFGTESLYVHMINFMPVTGITALLFDRKFVEGEFTNVLEPIYTNAGMAWKGYVACDKAILDPNAAWQDALQLVSFELDSALSLSQVLYWISTRNGFSSPTVLPPASTGEEESNPGQAPGSSCEEHPLCSSLGLNGQCCPTAGGVHLSCCT